MNIWWAGETKMEKAFVACYLLLSTFIYLHCQNINCSTEKVSRDELTAQTQIWNNLELTVPLATELNCQLALAF